MKKEKTKSKNGVARIVCIILACCMLIGAIMSGLAFCSKHTTEGKFGIFGKKVNEDNLIKREDYYENLLGEANCGITFNWKEDRKSVV